MTKRDKNEFLYYASLYGSHRQRAARGGKAVKLAGTNEDPVFKPPSPARALGPAH
jgi:hypothetical protein